MWSKTWWAQSIMTFSRFATKTNSQCLASPVLSQSMLETVDSSIWQTSAFPQASYERSFLPTTSAHYTLCLLSAFAERLTARMTLLRPRLTCGLSVCFSFCWSSESPPSMENLTRVLSSRSRTETLSSRTTSGMTTCNFSYSSSQKCCASVQLNESVWLAP